MPGKTKHIYNTDKRERGQLKRLKLTGFASSTNSAILGARRAAGKCMWDGAFSSVCEVYTGTCRIRGSFLGCANPSTQIKQHQLSELVTNTTADSTVSDRRLCESVLETTREVSPRKSHGVAVSGSLILFAHVGCRSSLILTQDWTPQRKAVTILEKCGETTLQCDIKHSLWICFSGGSFWWRKDINRKSGLYLIWYNLLHHTLSPLSAWCLRELYWALEKQERHKSTKDLKCKTSRTDNYTAVRCSRMNLKGNLNTTK